MSSLRKETKKVDADDAKVPVYTDSPTQDFMRMAVLTSLALYLRIIKLGFPPFITEIELETTRQVNWYMSGKFFIGKFPPLMGIVATGIARLVGYYGTEDLLYAGQPFIEFPLVALRRFSALLGTGLIPLCYMTLRNMGHNRSTATLASVLLVFENGIVTQSRYATPEMYALFFSALVMFSWTTMQKHIQQSQGRWTAESGLWQTLTGISMGCAISSKWTGVLVFPTIWVTIIMETWKKLCVKQNNVKLVLKQVFAYFVTVGILPLFVYSALFQFHFNLVPNAGDHDLLISSKLRYSLQGNQPEFSQPNIAFGSRLVIKHMGTVGGYLHSHNKRFTGGSTQQEVTLYPYSDLNNIWVVHKNGIIWNNSHPLEFVRNGDQIRLEHFPSTRKLHSHDHRPQLTGKPEHNEVTAYGDRLISDSHDYWHLQILNEDGTPSEDRTLTWKPLTQKFRLQHIRGCMLVSHHAWYLPPVGEGHQEVTCMVTPSHHIMAWQVESAYHEQMEGTKMITHDKISMVEKLTQVHKVMYKYPSAVYNRLQTHSAEDGSSHPARYTEETPNKWFFKKSSDKIWNELSGFSAHLVLHPTLQQLITASLIFYLVSLGMRAFLQQRQIRVPGWCEVIMSAYYTRTIVTFYAATLIHLQLLSFLPSHTTSMSDILHVMYYGASLVSVLVASCTVRLHPLLGRAVRYALLCSCIVQFSALSRLAYGGEKWFRGQCETSGLDMDCLRFPPAHNDLVHFIHTSGKTQNATLMTIYVELAAGATQPLRYNQGQEEEADRHIAVLKQNSFLHEAAHVSGVVRYHRAIPTPALPVEEAARWAQEVHQQALYRQIEMNPVAVPVEEQQQQQQPQEEQQQQQPQEEQQQQQPQEEQQQAVY